MNRWIYILLILVAFGLGYCKETKEVKTIEKEKIITKTKVDTIVRYYPLPYLAYWRGDTIHVTDTILKVEVREYVDSLYNIRISGYRPQLEYVEVYRPHTTIEKVKKERRIGLGVTAGYGISKDGLSPGIMIGISYRLY